MPRVMAVAFEPLGKLFYVDPGEGEYSYGQVVRVATEDGAEVARCVWGPVDVPWTSRLRPCLGPATPEDERRDEDNRRRRAEIVVIARRLVARHGLEMRVVGVDFGDQSDEYDQQAAIYFEAPRRVDFRALLPDLARALKARIDLRQIGSRDAAAVVGGLGPCGREVCCAAVGPQRSPVASGLARDQAPTHSASQLLGTCGRTMCCLTYERELYADFRARAPKKGESVETEAGRGVVVGHSVPLDSVVVKVGSERFTCPLARICPADPEAGRRNSPG